MPYLINWLAVHNSSIPIKHCDKLALNLKGQVKWNGILSYVFHIKNGVRHAKLCNLNKVF